MDDAARRARHAKAFEVFVAAKGLAGAERAALLAERCRGDDDLRALVERLLAAAESGDDFLERGAGAVAIAQLGEIATGEARLDDDEPQPLPERIGGYRIVSFLGRGAMGVVYEAEQETPRRRVALKALASSLVSRDIVQRFRREAQLLAALQDPGIAQVFDAGTDVGLGVAGGQHYFVMELVRGLPMTEHARSKGLSARESLALLALACDAVAHAHAQGIVHRDLKPANILVTESGQPKVLDFGVARGGTESAVTTLHTSTGVLMGTLAYMSPEQAGGRPSDADQRVDVYALGVIAFELLTGRLPHDFEGASLGEALDVVRHRSAPDVRSIVAGLDGDAATIVAKALELDASRRYETVAALAADIRRYLAGEPILARPPSVAYRAVKFVRRHRTASTLAGVLVVTLAVGAWIAHGLDEDKRVETARASEESARAILRSAARAMADGDPSFARRLLADVPSSLRGWEWRYFAGRLDQAARSLSDRVVLVSAQEGEAVPDRVPRDRAPMVAAGPEGRFLLAERSDEGFVDVLAWSAEDGSVARVGRLGAAGPHEVEEWAIPFALGFVPFPREHAALTFHDPQAGTVLELCACDAEPPDFWSVSPQGPTLVASFDDHWHSDAIRLCDWTTGRRLARHLGNEGVGTTPPFVLLGDGAIAFRAIDFTVAVYDLATGRSSRVWRADSNDLHDLAARPGTDRLLTCSSGGSVREWDGRTGALVAEARGHRGIVRALDCSPDGSLVATAGDDGTVRVWKGDLSREVAVFSGHAGPVLDVAFGADGYLASVDGEGQARLWDATATDDLWSSPLASFGYAVAASPNGELIADAVHAGGLRLRDASTGEEIASWSSLDARNGVAFDAASRRLALTTIAGGVIVLDPWTGATTRGSLASAERGEGVDWLPDGRLLASAPDDVAVLDGRSLAVVARPATPGGLARPSPDGRQAAVRTGDGVATWDLRDGSPLVPLAGWTGVLDLAWSPDGRWLAAATESGRVLAWDVRRGRSVADLDAATGEAFAVAFLPDSSRLVTGGRDGSLRSWSVPDFSLMLVLRGHGDYIHDIAASPDGETLVTVSGDRTLRAWSTQPVTTRAAARRRRAALVEEARPILADRLSAGIAPERLAEVLAADTSLRPDLRRVAIQLAVGRLADGGGGGAAAAVRPPAAAAAAGEAGPEAAAEIAEPSFDAGAVEQGAEIAHAFAIRNSGRRDLTVSAKDGCACTVVALDPVIPPGGVGRIVMTVDTSALKGPVTKRVTVTTNDPAHPRLTLAIQADVAVPLDVEPRAAVRFEGLPEELVPQEVVLRSTDDQPFDVTGLEHQDAQFAVTVTAAPQAGTAPETRRGTLASGVSRYSVVIAPTEKLLSGRVASQVTLLTSHPKAARLPIRIGGTVASATRVLPQALVLATTGGVRDEERLRHVEIQKLTGPPLEILGVSSDSPDVRATLATVVEGRRYDLHFRYVGPPTTRMRLATVEVRTSDPRRPVLQVAVLRQLEPPPAPP